VRTGDILTAMRAWPFVLFLALVACDAASPPGAAPLVLRKGNGAEVETLDPQIADTVQSSNVQRDLFEGLVSESPDGAIVPGVAARWEVSADALTWTFHLREDARWSDGSALTAADFVYSLRRAVAPRSGGSYAEILSHLVNARAVTAGTLPPEALGVSAPDARTLVVALAHPTPQLLGILTNSNAYPVQQANVVRDGAAFTRAGKLVSNGAYALAEWVPNSHMRLVKNPHYWGAAEVQVDEVWYYPTDDQAAELKRFRAGEIDWTYTLPEQQLDWARAEQPAALQLAPWLGVQYLALNTTDPALHDVRVRTALALAIDREVLTTKLARSGERPAFAFVPPMPGYAPVSAPWADWTQAEREAEAKRLLAAAGYGPGHPLALKMLVDTRETYRRLCLAVAGMWQATLGVEATLDVREFKVYVDARKQAAGTQVVRAGWIGDYADPWVFLELLRSTNGLNDTRWNDAGFDALLDAAGGATTLEARALAMQRAEARLIAELPVVPLYYYATRRLVRPGVTGWQPNPLDHHYTRSFRVAPAPR
jgi:ABC-type oligopeptide transport system substrate-binding subunit